MNETFLGQDEITPGLVLARKRVELKLSLAQVAKELKLKQAIIQSLENPDQNYSDLSVYQRGYLKSYARLLDLDVSDLLNEPAPKHVAQKTDLVQRPNFARYRKPKPLLAWGLVASTVLLAYWYIGQSTILSSKINDLVLQNLVANTFVTKSDKPIRPAHLPVHLMKSPSEEPLLVMDFESQSLLETSKQPSISADFKPIKTAEAKPLTAPIVNHHKIAIPIQLQFSGESWVEIQKTSGERVAFKMFYKNDSFDFPDDGPFEVLIGNAPATQLLLHGKTVNLETFQSGNVARFNTHSLFAEDKI